MKFRRGDRVRHRFDHKRRLATVVDVEGTYGWVTLKWDHDKKGKTRHGSKADLVHLDAVTRLGNLAE